MPLADLLTPNIPEAEVLLYGRTIANQKEIIQRNQNLIDFLRGHIAFLEDYIKEIKEGSDKVKTRTAKR